MDADGLGDDDIILQLMEEYAEQLDDVLNEVEVQVVNLGKSGTVSLELSRHVHSMKGAGASFGIQLVSTICHHFEDQLATLKSGVRPGPKIIDQFLTYVDLLRSVRKIVLDPGFSQQDRLRKFQSIADNLHNLTSQGQIRVLVAVASRSLVALITQALDGSRASILSVNDGLVVLTRALNEPFDVVVVAHRLKGLEGPGVIAALKNSGRKRIPHCVLLTSNVNDKKQALCGADQYLQKSPNGIAELVETITSSMGKSA